MPKNVANKMPLVWLEKPRPESRPTVRRAVELAHELNTWPLFDLDGAPSRLMWEEFQAMRKSRYVRPQEKTQLALLHPYFFTQGFDDYPLECGGKLRTSPATVGNVYRRVNDCLKTLARSEKLGQVVANTVVHVAPEGEGIESFFDNHPDYSIGMGLANYPNLYLVLPALQDNRTLVHELTHMLEQLMGVETWDAVDEVWRQLCGPEADIDVIHLNPREFFAHGAELYLCGHGEHLRQACEPLFDLCREQLGVVDVGNSGLTPEAAQRFAQEMVAAFRTQDADRLFAAIVEADALYA